MKERVIKQRFGAAVLGLGKIGQGFDYDRSDDSVVATHASAYARHPGYELLAGVDPDPVQRNRFEEKFRLPAYPDIRSLMEHHSPDIFSVASPSEQHLSVFLEVVEHKPLAIICEKPIAVTGQDGRRMQLLAEQNRCALLVNYMRRFEPGSMEVERMVHSNEMGGVFKGVAWYSKGLLNNGSHFIDLLRYWLGEVTAVEVMSEGRKWSGLDPEPDICLHFNETPVYLLAGREELFSVGKIDLFCTKGTVSYADFGNLIELRKTCESPFFEGYTILGPDVVRVKTDLKRYQMHVLEGLYRHLTLGEELNSDGRSATATLDVIERVRDQLDKGAP